MSGSIYNLSYDCICEIVKWQNKSIFTKNDKYEDNYMTLGRSTYDLCFLDEKGDEITGTTLIVKNIDVFNLSCANLDKGGHMWLITPLVGGVAKSYIKWVSVDVPKDDVANIATASISVEE